MKLVLFLAGLISTSFAEVQLSPAEEEEARRALQNPDLYDGDMAGIDGPADPERNAIAGSEFRWPNGIIPFFIDRSLEEHRALILEAMDHYHNSTCVRFVERTDEEDCLKLFLGRGCYSQVGRVGGRQTISLGYGCYYVGTVVHELGHTLGFYHEQSRSDRDDYLTINLDNVHERAQPNFKKLHEFQNILYNEFDYDSLMIYGNRAFSMNGKDTMVAKNGQILLDPYKKKGMTHSDIERVRKMYNC